MSAYWPVPFSVTFCGPVGSGSPILNVAVNVPTACGVKVMPYVQLEFAGTLEPQVLLTKFQYGDDPLKVALVIDMGVDPAFWNVIVFVLLVVPTV